MSNNNLERWHQHIKGELEGGLDTLQAVNMLHMKMKAMLESMAEKSA